MLINANKKQILKSFLETIREISDKEYQKRVWIRGDGPEVNDFDETCCNFFPEGDDIIENHRDFGITETQYFVLKKFRDQFRAFSDEHDYASEFIETSAWNEITEMAKDVLIVFNHQNKHK